MKTYDLFKQYLWLVDIIHSKRKLTLDEINQLWLKTEMSEGLPIARSTFNRRQTAFYCGFAAPSLTQNCSYTVKGGAYVPT